MTHEEIIAFQAKDKEWLATPIGKALHNFKRCLEQAVRQDTEDSFTDKDRSSTTKAWHESQAAEKELRKLLGGPI